MRFAGQAINGGNYINAASNAGGDISAALAKTAPNWGTSSKMGMKTAAEEAITGMQASANVATAGIAGTALAQQGVMQAEAIKAQGEAAASATQSQGLSSMLGSIGGAAIGAFKPKAATTSFGSYGPSNFNLNQNFLVN